MATPISAPRGPKPALSSKLMGLKFMQRAAHKEAVQNSSTEASQPSEDVSWHGGGWSPCPGSNESRCCFTTQAKLECPLPQAHWVKESAAQRCVVVFGGDPPLSCDGHNRVSFGGQNIAVEAETRLATARAAAIDTVEAVDDAGATVSDAELASRWADGRNRGWVGGQAG